MTRVSLPLSLLILLSSFPFGTAAPPQSLPGSRPLTIEGDIAAQMISGIHTFLDRQIDVQRDRRFQTWPQPSSQITPPTNVATEYLRATQPLRQSLAYRIGIRETRVTEPNLRVESAWPEKRQPNSFDISRVKISSIRWNVFDDLIVRGLCITPPSPQATVIAIPDASQSPEQLCGQGPESSSYAIELAKRGVQVFVPEVIQRTEAARNGRAVLTDQEFLYRSSFVLGRHPLGYQVQTMQSLIDAIRQANPKIPIGLAGWGEGGWVALHTAVVDERVSGVLVSGHFQSREEIWREPIHRNVQGLLVNFGDAELAALVAPRKVIIDTNPGPIVRVAGQGAAPGSLTGPAPAKVDDEWTRALKLLEAWGLSSSLRRIDTETANATEANTPKSNTSGQPTWKACEQLLRDLLGSEPRLVAKETEAWDPLFSAEERRSGILHSWDRHQQRILEGVHLERAHYWRQLKTNTLAEFEATVAPYREEFRKEIIGDWELPKKHPDVRTRYQKSIEGIAEYDVVLDVFDDVFAFGKLLIPLAFLDAWSDADSNRGSTTKRPCVVFQHGLEGRPDDTIAGDHPAYHDVSMQLAKQGYIVFAPQNIYLFEHRFRELQRKSNPLGKTLFSTMVSQHEVIVEWLRSVPIIDPNRVAFYGLSYGGKSAMRIPALVPGYCLSICSADFNDWVWKNASTSSPYSYVWTKEYEIFEFDLGPKFNYAEMATLIAPRPFMVERGHFDGVAPDDRVGSEFSKVNRLYSALLKIPDRAAIEWFPGPHTIHGKGTFEFLRRHLQP